MLHFRMDMPLYLMALYGSVLIVIVLLLRGLLKNRLPKFVFPVFWGMVLLRLLVPFSLSSPFSLRVVPPNPFREDGSFFGSALAETAVSAEDGEAALVRGGGDRGQAIHDVSISNTELIPLGGTGERQRGGGIVEIEVSEEISGYASIDGGSASSARWGTLIPAVYYLGLAVTVIVLGRQKYHYSKKLKNGLLVENNETVNEMLRSMGMGHVLVFTSDEIASPMVCGLLNPRVYLPTRMDFQDKTLLRSIFAHETMHLRRRDNWMKAVMLAAICLNWYNPLVWIMSKCLSSDLEAACDEAVLKGCSEEERKDYARSLLAMAVSASRTTLLYSAFSRTEVEKRIKGVLHYKKATVFALLVSVLFLAGGGVVFATGGQAPFSSYLTSYCAGSNSRWGVKAFITRDLALGENAQERAENVIFSALGTEAAEDPEILEAEIRTALAEEFGVEKGAFELQISLCLSEEEVEREYKAWEITRGKDGMWLYQGKPIRVFEDRMLGSFQTREEGETDISIQRNRLGEITSVTVWRQGDSEFDRRTREREMYGQRQKYAQGYEYE